MNSYMKKRYIKRRELAISYLGSVCINCQSSQDLQFHHIDPNTKLYTIAKASSFSETRFWSEVEKCELLCSDCHATHHQIIHPCGTVHRYWQGCRCRDCLDARNKYNNNYRSQRKEHLNSDI